MSGVLADADTSIVATETVVSDPRMIECRRSPGNRRVAVVAGIGAGNVR